MFFLPFEYFEIYTHLSPEEVCRRLCSIIEPWHWYPADINRFFGTVYSDHFKISRKTGGGTITPPVILGKVEVHGTGSRIKITIRLDWFVVVWMIVIFGLMGFGILKMTSDGLIALFPTGVLQIRVLLTILFYLGSFSFGYLMMAAQLWGERISRKFLYELFEVGSRKDIITFRKFLGLNRTQQFILFLIFSVVILFLVTAMKMSL
jgi:hypothetical protein